GSSSTCSIDEATRTRTGLPVRVSRPWMSWGDKIMCARGRCRVSTASAFLDDEAVRFDREREHARARIAERGLDVGAPIGVDQADQAAAAACAADLAGQRTGEARPFEQLVDLGCGHPGRQALARLPFGAHDACDRG